MKRIKMALIVALIFASPIILGVAHAMFQTAELETTMFIRGYKHCRSYGTSIYDCSWASFKRILSTPKRGY